MWVKRRAPATSRSSWVTTATTPGHDLASDGVDAGHPGVSHRGPPDRYVVQAGDPVIGQIGGPAG